MEVFERLLHRLAHRFEGRKVNDARNVALLLKYLTQRVGVAAVDVVAHHIAPQNVAQPGQHRLLGVAEVIDENRLVARLGQLHHRVRADVARPARNKNFFHKLLAISC